MPLNLNSDKLIVVVKPEQQPLQVTGFTPTVITGSGGTTVTSPAYQQFIITSPASVLPTVLIGSGDTTTTNISGNTWIIFSNTGTTGTYTPLSAFTGHTGDTTIHFKQSGITITENQVTNLVSDLAGKSGTGHTHSYTGSSITNKPSFVGSGNTTVTLVGNTYHIYSPTGSTGNYVPITGTSGNLKSVIGNLGHQFRVDLTTNGVGKGGQILADDTYLYLQDVGGGNVNQIRLGTTQTDITKKIEIATGLTGTYGNQTLINKGYADTRYSQTGHTHAQYATVANLTGHTSDTTIHFKQSGITITENQVTNLVTDLAGKSGTGHTHSYTGSSITNKPSFVGSGNTTVTLVNNTYRIYTPSGISDHALLSNLGWLTSKHTGQTSHFAGFGLSGETVYYDPSNYAAANHLHTGVYSPTAHTHTQYSPTGHTHTIANVTGLQSALDGKSSTGHTHTGVYAPVIHTHAISGVTGLQTALDGKTNTGTTATLVQNLNTFSGATLTLYSDNKAYRGFSANDTIGVSYNWSQRKVTLTGTLDYYWNGIKKTFTSPKTFTTGHTATVGHWYLYSTDGTNFAWSQQPWSFDDMQIAHVYYRSTSGATFCIREPHGTMDRESHEVLHNTVGTFLKSGGQPFAYTAATATNSANSPSFGVAVVVDEDLDTTIPQWDKGTYTLMTVTGNTASRYYTAATLPFSGANNTNVYLNNPVTGAFAASTPNNRWLNVYQILVPTSSDVPSQKYRMIMLQPQAVYTSLAAAQAESVLGLYLGDLNASSAEYVIYTRITYATAGSSNYGKCTIAGISYNIGNHLNNVNVTGGASTTNHQNLANLDWANSGHIASTISTLASFNSSGIAEELPKATFSLSGHTHSGVYQTVALAVTGATSMGGKTLIHATPVSGNKIQLKGLSGGTNITITTGATYLTISSTAGGSSAWSGVTGKPAWLSGTTLSAFEAQHAHATLYQPLLANVVTVTGTTDTIANGDGGTIIKYTNTSARTVTLPTGLTTNMQFTAINYGGTTTVSFAAGTGATLHTKNSALKLATIYGACTWIHEGSGTWVGFGDLTV
jgi:hypothetical protein